MSGEKNDNPNEEKDPLEVDDTNNYDELDDILDDDKGGEKDKGNKGEGDDDKGSSDKNKNENKEDDGEKSNKFLKKVGNHEFHSEKDYDEFVQSQYNTNSRFAGEIKKLGGDPKALSKALNNAGDKDTDDKTKTDKTDKEELTDEDRYYRVEAVRFTKQFPVSKEYKEEMGIFIRKGKANINGEPSYAAALFRALRADGKPIPQKLIDRINSEKGDDEQKSSRSASKRVMKSGGSNSNTGASGQDTYSDDDVEELSDFGNKIATGSIRSF